jgi:hypothetical protein
MAVEGNDIVERVCGVFQNYNDASADLDRVEEVLNVWERELDDREADFSVLNSELQLVLTNHKNTEDSLKKLNHLSRECGTQMARLKCRK